MSFIYNLNTITFLRIKIAELEQGGVHLFDVLHVY
jgi:hypothetical protein